MPKGYAMRGRIEQQYWTVMLGVLGLILIGCTAHRAPQRAIGIPAAATRTPDFVLPLAARERDLALLYLNKTTPAAAWEEITDEQIKEHLAIVTPDITQKFQAILDVLSQLVPTAADLEATGSVGSLFQPPGAYETALDARLQGEIARRRDLRVGLLHQFYFVFYRRYPQSAQADGVCESAPRQDRYCRLVIVTEVDTRKD